MKFIYLAPFRHHFRHDILYTNRIIVDSILKFIGYFECHMIIKQVTLRTTLSTHVLFK